MNNKETFKKSAFLLHVKQATREGVVDPNIATVLGLLGGNGVYTGMQNKSWGTGIGHTLGNSGASLLGALGGAGVGALGGLGVSALAGLKGGKKDDSLLAGAMTGLYGGAFAGSALGSRVLAKNLRKKQLAEDEEKEES